jgi:hypothetical protein
MRRLAASPRDFNALIAAGNAALDIGDTQAAIGFFGRADEVHPASPLPQAGLGAALVADGDARSALPHFARAQQLGANRAMLGKDRGLAYDLLGQHGEAQADYRAALYGTDPDEARRRLALSLAISGKKEEAIAQLAPLSARGDAGAARVRALVLALNGEPEAARRALDARMPGSGAQMDSYFRRLPSLRSDQKAAAVHLGIFPGSGGGYAVASVAPSQPINRIQSIDHWLRQPATPRAAPPAAPRAVQVASVTPAARTRTSASAAPTVASVKPKIWLQLASGTDPNALSSQFRRIKSRGKEVLEGISGYVVQEPSRARLLIGPFKDRSDAELFAEDLESVSVDSFSWTSAPGQAIRKLSNE